MLSQYTEDGRLVFQSDGRKGVGREFVHLAGSLIAQREYNAAGATITYLHTDALGSPVASTNQAGAVVERTHYEPYGAPIGKVVDGPGYTGHVMDSATGLSYMQQRYMDPQLGVFLSVDPVTAYEQPVGQFNRYRYANGNPYTFSDPDGGQASERFVEQHREDMEAGNGAVYAPLQPYAIAATAVMLTPVVVEVRLAIMTNPGAVATATNIAAEAAGVTGAAGAAGLAAKEVGPLLRAANKPFNATGLSVAARKLEHHATRPGGTFAAPTGSVAQKNEAAGRVVEGLLKSPDTVKTSLSGGGAEYRGASGQGVRFEADGSFNTFLDPKR
ncbi:RHS repeat-associated core domain-containing protein [Stenotrophomonas sp. NPDC101269]|uniref:RHS repeat-associated core domain-containing protein n=1 Tax=Stenotrophomonas TaxID=40323 RepID=UPI001291B793